MKPDAIGSRNVTDKSGDWLEQYKELARLMYALRRHCPRLPVLALSTLHPRHPVPVEHLEMMACLEKVNKSEEPSQSRAADPLDKPRLTVAAEMFVRYLLYVFRETVSLFRLRWQLRPLLERAKREPADVVMKTWGFGPESLSNRDDFYYGMLPHLLKERGISYVSLCGDARGGATQSAFERSALSQTHMRYFPEKALVPLGTPLVIALKQLSASFALWRLSRKAQGDKKFAMICRRAALDCLSPFTAIMVLYYYIAMNAVKTWDAKVFITLYEGQPWEMPAWQGAKAANKECVTVGYQHTVVMAHSLSLVFPNHGSWELPAPEVVLCLGEVTKNRMKPGHERQGTKLVRFGSFRRAHGGPAHASPQPGKRTVLVLPEGLPGEAKMLFNCAMRVSRSLPDHRFIFRCHPVLPFARVSRDLEGVPEEFPNIEVSDRKNIADDFRRASVVLYRGSSAVLYAVLHGLKPIYLHNDRDHDVDPLFELVDWHEYASSVSEVEQILHRYAATSAANAWEEWRSAADYVNAYAMPVDEESVDRFLAAVGLQDLRSSQ